VDLYALHCAECHGSRGQGEIGQDAAKLDDDYMRSRQADWLYKVIARGRSDTEMAAFHLEEGGVLNRQQIDSLVTVAARVAELGMISEEELALASSGEPVEALESPPEMAGVSAAEGQAYSMDSAPTTVIVTQDDRFPNDPPGPHATDEMSGRRMYKEFCEECHGQQGMGTADAPQLGALNAIKIAETVRDGPEDMDVFTHDDIPDRALNDLIDYVLMFHRDSEPRPGTIITPPTSR
jgi:mono/diheme cytochrome c family protein